jgi:hypothetical protein
MNIVHKLKWWREDGLVVGVVEEKWKGMCNAKTQFNEGGKKWKHCVSINSSVVENCERAHTFVGTSFVTSYLWTKIGEKNPTCYVNVNESNSTCHKHKIYKGKKISKVCKD